MNVQAPAPTAESVTKLGIVDCDIHPRIRTIGDLRPYLSERWWKHLNTYGMRVRHGQQKGTPYPKAAPMAARRDAWPETGGQPGSDLAFMQRQLLDAYGVELGILNPLAATGQGLQDDGLSAALCRATNHWQVEAFTGRDRRLKASICVPYEDGEAAAREIEAFADHPDFAQVLLLSRTAEPLGRKRYWPIFEAAAAAGKPVGVHVFGYSGWPTTPAGHPSYYIEEMTEHAASAQAMLSSLVFEGVFERFPKTRLILIEAGFAWLPALAWRMDRNWERMRDEVPHVRRPPSEYLREHLWVSTQPMEEPEDKAHLADILAWIGPDRVLFASDYPHWDFDDPTRALPPQIDPATRRMILHDNAARVFGLAA